MKLFSWALTVAALLPFAQPSQALSSTRGQLNNHSFNAKDFQYLLEDHNLRQQYQDEKQHHVHSDSRYEFVAHPSFSDHRLRVTVTQPKICDSSVKQYAGYLDITDERHLFFWFFESRSSPKHAPLVLWLNGGPACSSSTGLLFELGPCNIANGGKNTTYNPYSWNTHANIIFIDQPINVGYSYSEGNSTVDTSPVAGKDVYAFLQLFFQRFPEYADLPFHIAAESYGGIYGPNFASVIHKENKLLPTSNTELKHINLASVVLANGLTDPYIQFGSFPEYVCEGPYAVYNPKGPECAQLRQSANACQRLVKDCYENNTAVACIAASVYCAGEILERLFHHDIDRNPYDGRKKCEESKSRLCYKELDWIDIWLNNPDVKADLGVDPKRNYSTCNEDLSQAFIRSGDLAHNSADLLPELVNDGVRLLVYAGNTDLLANHVGNARWVEQLRTVFSKEYSHSKTVPWISMDSGMVAGKVRTAGGGGSTAGNITFVEIFEAGHMAPHDQPEATLDLIKRWIKNIPLQ